MGRCGAGVALTIVLACVASAARAQGDSTPPPFPAPGRLVAVGGWRLHLNCTGEARPSQPTVSLEAGLGDFSVEWSLAQPGVARFARVLVTGAPIPPVKTSDPLRVADIPPRIMEQIRAGVAQVSRDPNGGVRGRLPPDAQRMRAWTLAHIGHILAGVNPVEHEELAALRTERAKSDHPLGDLPLVVVTRGVPDESGPNAAALEAEHRNDHTALATLSRRGKLVVATRSGHHVQLEEPELVVSAIRDVVVAARR